VETGEEPYTSAKTTVYVAFGIDITDLRKLGRRSAANGSVTKITRGPVIQTSASVAV
jgi:hypothetical protein